MSPDILIVREGDGYRLLHGHLHLAGKLLRSGEAAIEVRGEGTLKVVKTRCGYVVRRGMKRLPLYQN